MPSLLLALATLAVAEQNPPSSSGGTPSRTVKVRLLVTGKSGHAVTDLRQEDVLLFEGDKPQKALSFAREDLPLNFGLIVDATGSMRDELENAIAAMKSVVNAMQLGDDAFLVRLRDNETTVIMDWTGDKDNLLSTTIALRPAHGTGSLIDALMTCSKHFTTYPHADATVRRRALVLISDGIEYQPQNRSDNLMKALRAENLSVFIVCLDTPPSNVFEAEMRRDTNEWLKKLARETGGQAYFPKSADFPRIADDLVNQQRTQYVVSYESTSLNVKSKLRVKLTGGPGRDKYSVTAQALSN
jgi:VWFA-related protein